MRTRPPLRAPTGATCRAPNVKPDAPVSSIRFSIIAEPSRGSGHLHHQGALGEFHAEAALVHLRHEGAFKLVALVEEGHAEGVTEVAEDGEVLGPGDDRARADRKSTRLNSSHSQTSHAVFCL